MDSPQADGDPGPPIDLPLTGAAPSHRRRFWAVARFVVGLALGGFALEALNGDRDELVGASTLLGRMHVGWLVVAIGAEILSVVSFALLQRRLLRVGGVRVSLGWMSSVSLATLT
ncbi:MAG TPA: hypothetical protein VMD59_05890, partial [Acidimicrobiales bacterium]|nr:hypothetical protein [Acidimicrobiales bacterium]